MSVFKSEGKLQGRCYGCKGLDRWLHKISALVRHVYLGVVVVTLAKQGGMDSAAVCCSKARTDDMTSEISTPGSTSAFTGYLISGRSLTLPGRSSPTGSSASNQSTSGGISISNTHSLSLPNLQQHCAAADASSFINDPVEWVSLMTSMNLGEVGDVDDATESRLVNKK